MARQQPDVGQVRPAPFAQRRSTTAAEPASPAAAALVAGVPGWEPGGTRLPPSAQPRLLLALQRTVGNGRVQQLLSSAQPERGGAPAVVQRFGGKEHQSLGNEATGSALVNVGGETPQSRFELQHGDVVTLTGDYFTAHQLMHLATLPGDRGTKVGTRDEIVWALHDVNKRDARFQPGGPWANYDVSDSSDVAKAVLSRYQQLAAANVGHFVAPRGRDASGQPRPGPAGEASAGTGYRTLHETALRMAYQAGRGQGTLSHAMAIEAAAQHFLTDSFAAGHLTTAAGDIREYWGKKYPLFWYNLRHKIALDTAVHMNAQTTNVTTVFGSVQQMYEAISAQVEKLAERLPAVTLGDLLLRVFHDYDNEKGINIAGGGRVYGDSHLDEPDPQNVTRRLAVEAIRAGNKDVEEAFAIGQAGTDLDEASLYAAIQKATGAPGGSYLPETKVPRPDATTPAQNWQAPSFEDVWNRPIVGAAGPTVGDRIKVALQPGQEIRNQLDALASEFPEVESRWSGNLRPRQAYQDGFVQKMIANPRAGILDTINWAPSYGLSGEDRDDVSVATGEELARGGQLGGMTPPARVRYVRELIGGAVFGDEEQLVVQIFETAAPAERPGIYRGVEGHDWTGDWIHGWLTSDDEIWNALNRTRLAKVKNLINAGWGGRR